MTVTVGDVLLLLFGCCTVARAGAAAADVPVLRTYGLCGGGRDVLDWAVDVEAAAAVVLLLFFAMMSSLFVCCSFALAFTAR